MVQGYIAERKMLGRCLGIGHFAHRAEPSWSCCWLGSQARWEANDPESSIYPLADSSGVCTLKTLFELRPHIAVSGFGVRG